MDLAWRDSRLRVVGGDDHRLEQVFRRGAPLGILETLARGGDEVLDGTADRGDAFVELAVGSRLPPAPGRQRGHDATKDRREDLVQVALDDVVVRLERVHLGPERQARDGVDRVAHQVALQVDRRAGVRRAASVRRALAHLDERREVGAQVARIEARHDHPALALPHLAFGAEDADRRRADLGGDLGEPLGAAKAIGPVAHQRTHRRVVGDDQDAPAADPEAEVRPVLAHPALDLLVHAGTLELQHVAQKRQPRWRRQVVDLAQPGRRGGGRGNAFGLDGHAEFPFAQCLAGAAILRRISRACSRSQSRFFSVLRLSCSALPLARAISALTRPPL